MACGKLVVSTLSGSIPEVVGDAGILVQPNDHLSLYEALKQLIMRRALYDDFKNKSRDHAVRYYGTYAIAEKLKSALNRIMDSRS